MAPIYSLHADEVYQALDTTAHGVSEEEARRRLWGYGPNEIKEAPRTPLVLRFLANFYQVFALLLWASIILAFISGSDELAWTIIAVIVLNAVFSFVQEYQAGKAVEALRKLLPAKARVFRDSQVEEILARDLVPGDMILMEAGDHISADARLVEENELRTNNASLTGESEPVRRSADPVPERSAHLIEVPNLVFAGTWVAFGSGRAVVFATGMETQFGKIAGLTQGVRHRPSPLQVQVRNIALIIAAVALAGGAALFAAGTVLAELPPSDASLFAIGMITANVPEGLLPTLTLALAAGVRALARRNALVKRLSAVETMGSVTTICTDKTGTLTANEMTVREIWIEGRSIHVTGVGYEPKGGFLVDSGASPGPGDPYGALDARRFPTPAATQSPGSLEYRAAQRTPPETATDTTRLLLRAASFCNNPPLIPPLSADERSSIVGDPTEAALLVLATKGGIDYQKELTPAPRVCELPFESRRKRVATIHREDGGLVAYVKGAPKEGLSIFDRIVLDGRVCPLTAELREAIADRNDGFALCALRVLALAFRPLPAGVDCRSVEQVERELVFIGLAAMMDPPRPEVSDAIRLCYGAGIRG